MNKNKNCIGRKRSWDSNIDITFRKPYDKRKRFQNMFVVGNKVEVEDDGFWYFAEIIEVDGDLVGVYFETEDGSTKCPRLKFYCDNIRPIPLEPLILTENCFHIDPDDEKIISLVRACINYSYFSMTEKLLRFIKINHKFCTSNENDFLYTFLHFACEYNNINMIEFLVKRGADINAETFDGNYPLTLLTKKRNKEAIMKFLDYNPNLMLSFGKFGTLFEYLLNFWDEELTEKIFPKTYEPMTPVEKKIINQKILINLIRSRKLGYVKQIFQENDLINVSFQDKNGQTAFHHLAIISKNCCDTEIKTVFNLLLRKGYDSLYFKDKYGRTALYYVSNPYLCERLLEYSVCIDYNDICDAKNEKRAVLIAKFIKSLKIVGVELQNEVINFCSDLQSFFYFLDDRKRYEVSKMKSMKNNLISVHDLLMKDIDTLFLLYKKKEVRDFLKKIKYKVEFPCYGRLLQNRFDAVDEKSRLLPLCSNHLNKIINESFNINFPIFCTQEILKDFNCSELIILL